MRNEEGKKVKAIRKGRGRIKERKSRVSCGRRSLFFFELPYYESIASKGNENGNTPCHRSQSID